MTDQQKTKTTLIRIGIQSAVWGGVIASVIGWALVGLFGLFLFSDRYPALTGLGKIGFSLAFLLFPIFVPVAGFLSLSAVLFTLKKRHSLTLRSFSVSFGIALVLIALISSAVNMAFMLREKERSVKARQDQESLSQFRSSIFRVQDIIVKPRGDSLVIKPTLSGALEGTYRVTVTIADNAALVSEAMETSLPSDMHEPMFNIPLSVVRSGFRRVHMHGSQQEVIVGPMQYQIKIDLALLSSTAIADLDIMLPAISPDRISTMHKSVTLDLGRF